ncbi:AMP-binding protein [Sorangium sp. So ce281]|uniref:AMP-binding protein n=1 Tax=unclassified Sorangium TaxID=2621164 RepID=UPI003F648F94
MMVEARFTLVDLLQGSAETHAGRPAYTFLSDGESVGASLPFEALDRRARGIAAHIQSCTKEGERVLLLLPQGIDYVAAFFGCLYAGVVGIPLYEPQPRLFGKISAVGANATPSLVLIQSSAREAVDALFSAHPVWQGCRVVALDTLDESAASRWRRPPLSLDRLAYLQYTAGSTSTPKGVMITHGNLVDNLSLLHERLGHDADTVHVSWLPQFHDMGLVIGTLLTLYGGGHTVFMSPMSFIRRPLRWLAAISKYRGHTTAAPNFAYRLCIERITPAERDTLDLSSWSIGINGAEPIDVDTTEQFAEYFAPAGLRRTTLCPGYGLAESTVAVSVKGRAGGYMTRTVQRAALERHELIDAQPGTDGATTLVEGGSLLAPQILIVDPETRVRCEPTQVGEIWVAGDSVGQGYWALPEESEHTFRGFLADTGKGPFLRTGDLGFISEGHLFITGRIKDLIIIRGRNHYPHDIEESSLRSHPALRPISAAFSIQVEGREEMAIVQEVRAQEARGNLVEMMQAIRQCVAADHELRPYVVVLVRQGTIPKTTSGKTQRSACRAALLAGKLDELARDVLPESQSTAALYKADWESVRETSPAERHEQIALYLCTHVAKLLKADPAAIDRRRSLGQLGMDSLRVVELKERIEADNGVSLSVATMFEAADLVALGAYVLALWEQSGKTAAAAASDFEEIEL